MVGENRRHWARGKKERNNLVARADLDGGGPGSGGGGGVGVWVQETLGHRGKRDKEQWLHVLTLMVGGRGVGVGGWVQETLGHRGNNPGLHALTLMVGENRRHRARAEEQKREKTPGCTRHALTLMVGENRRHRGTGKKERKEPWFARADLDGGREGGLHALTDTL